MLLKFQTSSRLLEEKGMKIIKRSAGYVIGLLLCFSALFACAPFSYLNINYRLPIRTDELKGKKVFLAFEDARRVKEIIGAGARKEFENFSGDISLSLARGTDPEFKIGIFEVPSLFKEAFRSRLENLGVEVISKGARGGVGLVIVLKEFYLDLQSRKWKVRMGYEASLIKESSVLAKQMISGQGERVKLLGRGQADTVIGEIFTDLVNRLDVPRLFQQADLL